MNKKKWLLVPGSVALLAVLATTAFANNPIKMLVDGKLLNPSTPPSLVNNHVLVPARDLAEAMGAKVTWDGESSTVSIQSAPTTNTTNNMKAQLDQLQRAVAPESPQDAVGEWAKGCQTRNGALQYAVMTPDLQKQNYDSFAQMGWSTGVSSPWISNTKIIKSTQISDTKWQFNVQFESMTSTGLAGINVTQVTVEQIDKYWYVSELRGVDTPIEILPQSATLPDGTAVNQMTVSYDHLDAVSLRVFSSAVPSQPGDEVQSLVNFYGGGTILERETVNLTVGQANLALVKSKSDSPNVQPTLTYYLTVTRDYPQRDDMKMIYTLMGTFAVTGDQAAAKQDLLTIAQTWKLQQN